MLKAIMNFVLILGLKQLTIVPIRVTSSSSISRYTALRIFLELMIFTGNNYRNQQFDTRFCENRIFASDYYLHNHSRFHDSIELQRIHV